MHATIGNSLLFLAALCLFVACSSKKSDPCKASAETLSRLVAEAKGESKVSGEGVERAKEVQADMVRVMTMELCKKNRISNKRHECIKSANDVFEVMDGDGCGLREIQSLVGPAVACLDGATRKGPVEKDPRIQFVYCELAGERHGEYIEYAGNRILTTANYRKGKPEGPFRSDEGRVEGEYKEGKKSGIWQWKPSREDGYAELSFSDGVAEGNYRAHYEGPESALAEEGSFGKGLREGEWKAYWRGKVPKSTGAYLGGKRHGPWKFFRGANVRIAEGEYLEGERSGTWTFFDEQDQAVSEEEAMEEELVQEALADEHADHPSVEIMEAAAP